MALDCVYGKKIKDSNDIYPFKTSFTHVDDYIYNTVYVHMRIYRF